MKTKLALSLALVLAVGLAGAALAAEPIKVGVYFPMTGSNAVYGEVGWKGVQLALKDKPKVLDREIKLILVDTKSDKVEAANAVSRLVEKEKVDAIVGELTSSCSLAGAPVVEKAMVPTVSPWATNPLVTQSKKYYFRACFIDPFQGFVGAKYALENLKAKTAAVLIDITQDYCVGIANFFMKEYEKMGGKVVYKANYNTGDLDFSAQLTGIAQAKPDVIYCPGYFKEDALIAIQARQQGLKQPIVSGDAAQADELMKIGGQAVEGLAFTTHFDADGVTTEAGKKFVAAFSKANPGVTPDSVSALSYDSYNMVIEAMTRAKSAEKDKVAAELAKTKDFQGVTGVITLDANHDAIKPAVLLKVEGGKYKYVATVKP